MYHSITFGNKNTWDDWHLIPASRPVFAPPSVKFKYVDVPGLDGELDLTTVLSGVPLYTNRTGSLKFIVANDYLTWDETYATIMSYLHGQPMRAVLEDDFLFVYTGRFSVNEWRSDKQYSLIVINYSIDPYKKEMLLSPDDWLWDLFDFENGVVGEYIGGSL